MTTKVAPWLQGLSDDAWELPQQRALASSVSSASHDAGSIRSSKIPRRSLSGLPSSLSRQTSSSQASTQKRRNPLAALSMNETNTLRRQEGNVRPATTRSASEGSDESFAACGTVQQRSKSASPAKKQETMEWKRRLVHGRVGYGDQTDLFGPSGLENIFAGPKEDENDQPKPKSRMNWLQKSSDIPMPSSPPPWPSSFINPHNCAQEEPLDVVGGEEDRSSPSAKDFEADESFRSNPFDLESAAQRSADLENSRQRSKGHLSSPNTAFAELSEGEAAGNRTVSGQTELSQEDFSPVFISKHHTVTGQVGYTALDSHTIKQFQSVKVDLRHPSQTNQHQSSGSEEQDEVDDSNFTDGTEGQEEEQDESVAPDLSFSENLPTGSPFPNLGKHVELRRGGYSQYGSFKRKPLSPSQSTMALSNHPEASTLLSPILSEGHQRSPSPTPPRTPSVRADGEEPKSRPSGSPLKLFGAHDTFTNNRLLRRMSQLNPDGTLRLPAEAAQQGASEGRRVTSNGSFGQGELDDHQFDAEITITSASDDSGKRSDSSPGSEVPVPGSKIPMAFRFDVSPHITETYKLKRKLSKHSTATSRGSTLDGTSAPYAAMQPTVEDASISQLQAEPADEAPRSYAEGKRPPTSPFKSPTPKRRRTLHASELEDYMTRVNDTYHSQLQEAVSSRKRKDARHGDSQITAGPEVLAQRKILRPRNPTPSQCRREQIEAELREAAAEFAEQEPEKLEAVLEQIESSMTSESPQTLQQQAQAVASEVAAFTLKVRRPSGELGERKRSVTTQDFLNEAMMVMNLIRAKARPQSNLGSVEESDAEPLALSARNDGSIPEESLLRISRPPSREGSGWRQRMPAQTDARVVSHLRKFQEQDERDDTDFIANSIASLQVDDEEINDQVIFTDEHANIRITGPPSDRGKANNEEDSQPSSQRSQGSATDTQNSNGTSTGRTIGTSSTRKSDNVGTLAPDAVAHLIGEQVGGMTFDKEQQRWVRVGKSPAKSHGSFLELPSTVTSDDDPFREISDLPIDEQNEMRRISSPAKLVQEKAAVGTLSSAHDQAEDGASQQQITESHATSQETVISRPVTREGPGIRHNHSSSVPSRYTAFASSQQQDEVQTRATSWSDEELARMSAFGRAKHQPLEYAAAQTALATHGNLETIEQQSESADSSVETTIPAKIDVDSMTELAGLREDTMLDAAHHDVEDLASPKLRQTPTEQPFQPASYQTAPRQVSLRRQTLTNRFNAEAVDHRELSFVAPLPGDRMMSLSLSVSRPVSKRHQPWVANVPSSPSKVDSSFMLSDLPDFTVHEEDAERPSERALANRLAHHAATEVNDRYALAVKDLVKTLTDVNQCEPYWEDLKQLDLHGQSLASLYGLEDFSGLPQTVRKLNARSNQLSSLTSWNHLMNLQYLDASHNNLENLNGLGCLIHLRELRADDNKIASLDGLFELEGLLKVRVRRNELSKVDFSGSQLQHLTSLDLSQNHIGSIEGLDGLCSLRDLILDGNDLQQGLQVAHVMPHLTSISLRDCKLQHLDVSNFPALTHLIVDENCLSTIEGLPLLKNLQVLSIKRQDLPEGKQITLFDQPFDTRTLQLSGNVISSIDLAASFLSIQHLEMASVGLQELPDDFGLRMPNLRSLSLNFNNLKDIRPLLNIHGLKYLAVCGNRLHRLRKSVATVSKMKSLQTLDMRDTPMTQGFYPSMASTLSKSTCLIRQNISQALEDEDEHAIAFDSARYQYPAADVEQDKQYRSRLDEDTKLRRRVHEMLLAYSCRSLTELDGMKIDRSSLGTQDSVWRRLVELGVVRRSGEGDGNTSGGHSAAGDVGMRLLS
ncbi:Protein nud1 [Saxophila tyrrhenica]|uniref:Protein nud1 n=1 Tax=Saxophila tyrrhenica TaxID=1690608 RepID=A0AAV9P3E8_9PEZI|nr:Protein nud1 [Saxophila tyrrhenica]